jgi:hypothetical protein
VLAAVKTALRHLRRWPSARLDRGGARRPRKTAGRDPSNRGDQRIVPFLEEYPRSFRQLLGTASGVSQACFQSGYELESPFARTNHRADRSDRREDLCDASLVEGMDVKPAADEIRGDVRLKIGERQDEIGLQR